MKNIKKIIISTLSILAAFAALIFFISVFSKCTTLTPDKIEKSKNDETTIDESAAINDEDVQINTETIDFIPSEKTVKLLGRSIFYDNMVYMAYSSTGAAFNISAKRLDITIAGDSAAYMTKDNGSAARICVFINGERKLDELILQQTQTYTVFDSTELVEGEVQVVKVSESAQSLAGLEKITTDKDGTISPASAKSLKIEFIGDSITCGYGVDDLVKEHHFATWSEDNTKTYAYKAASILNADYSMVSISGWGIISGYTGNETKQAACQLPKYYDKLGFSWGNSLAGTKPQDMDWDFNSFQSDIVVINLGTNDASYTKGKSDRIEEYTNAYVEFLKDVRSKNPKAYIICSLGIMGQDLCGAIDKAVAAYKENTGDERICSFKFAQQNMSDGIGADWHPSAKTHSNAATSLVLKIKTVLNN